MSHTSDRPGLSGSSRTSNPFLALQGVQQNGVQHVDQHGQQRTFATSQWTRQAVTPPASSDVIDPSARDSFIQRMMPQTTGYGQNLYQQPTGMPASFEASGNHGHESTGLAPPLPRRPPSIAHDASVTATQQQQRPESRFSLLQQKQMRTTQVSKPNQSIQEIIRSALDSVMAAHEHDMFALRQPALETSVLSERTPSRSSPTSVDQMTEDFERSFPSLSEPSSPANSVSSKSQAPTALKGVSTESSFKSRLDQIATMLEWQLAQNVEARVSEEGHSWQQEKARGMQEMSEAEDELDNLRHQVSTMEDQMTKQRQSHNQDLEAAARTASELSDRVEILQTALNEARSAAGATSDAGSADAWTDIINEQASALRKFEQALSSMEPSVTCSVCTGVFNNPSTLPCGHSACLECLQGWLRLHRSCPTCREPALLGEALLRTTASLEGIVQVLRSVEVTER
ncbi:Tripartite motif-containing protein 65 [Microbotryomycetes sp. JL201]|nr:Tripartite motif-containing protein 65 [Microbotryomycetes sp. JL201]